MRVKQSEFEGGAAVKIAAKSAESSLTEAVERIKRIADGSFAEAAATDNADGFPVETLRKIAEANLLTAALPENLGGGNLGIESGTNDALLQILKHCGRGNLVVGRVYEGHFNALLLINLFGSAGQIETYGADAASGKLFGVWNTEAADGVKITPLENGKFRLEGAKTFATGVGFVERPIVNGALPDGGGWQMCVVPMEKVLTKVDASWWQPMGMRATRSFKVDFTNVEIERQDLIGAPGDYYRQPWFSGGAIRFAAVQFGAAEALFDETRRYLQELKRTDDPFQKMRLGEMAIAVESGNLWLAGAAKKLDDFMQNPSDERSENFLAYVNMMRTAIEQICLKTIVFCEKCVGARGLNKPYHFERIIRDLTIYLRQPAPDAALADAGRYVLQSGAAADDLWKSGKLSADERG